MKTYLHVNLLITGITSFVVEILNELCTGAIFRSIKCITAYIIIIIIIIIILLLLLLLRY